MKRKLLTILLATAACGALIGAVGCTGESSSGGGGVLNGLQVRLPRPNRLKPI